MPGINNGLRRKFGEFGRQAVKQLLGISARQIDTAASRKKQGVARNEGTITQKTLAPRSVAWRVDHRDLAISDLDHIPTAAWFEVRAAEPCDLLYAFQFISLYVHRNRLATDEFRDTFDVVTPKVPAAMIWMVVSDEAARDVHPVCQGCVFDRLDVPCGIDDKTFAGSLATNEVDKVLHRPKQELLKVQIGVLRSQRQLLDFGFFEDHMLAHDWIKLFQFKLVLTLLFGGRVEVAGFSGGNELDDVTCS